MPPDTSVIDPNNNHSHICVHRIIRVICLYNKRFSSKVYLEPGVGGGTSLSSVGLTFIGQLSFCLYRFSLVTLARSLHRKPVGGSPSWYLPSRIPTSTTTKCWFGNPLTPCRKSLIVLLIQYEFCKTVVFG